MGAEGPLAVDLAPAVLRDGLDDRHQPVVTDKGFPLSLSERRNAGKRGLAPHSLREPPTGG